MTHKIKVTVGMAVKNNEPTIQETIRGVLKQDFPHELMEIIVVDGVSKDQTLKIIRNNVANSDIRTKILSDGGGGLGLARQLIVENAEGEYVCWIDGDVVIPKNYISAQVRFLELNPQAGAVQGNKWNYEGESLAATLETMSNLHYFSEKKRNRLVGVGGAVHRLGAIRDAGGFDKSIKGAGEDIDLSFRMYKRGWLLPMNEVEWRHSTRETWKDLWEESRWYGYGMHFVTHKHKGLVVLWQWVPPVSFIAGYMRSLAAYRLTQKKTSFLLPLHYTFRNLAWILGYAKSHMDRYGHV